MIPKTELLKMAIVGLEKKRAELQVRESEIMAMINGSPTASSCRWSPGDVHTLLTAPSIAEAAEMLGRTITAVYKKSYKLRRKSLQGSSPEK